MKPDNRVELLLVAAATVAAVLMVLYGGLALLAAFRGWGAP